MFNMSVLCVHMSLHLSMCVCVCVCVCVCAHVWGIPQPTTRPRGCQITTNAISLELIEII